MNDTRFDNLARAFATTRRGMLKRALAGLVAGAAGRLDIAAALVQGCAAPGKTCAADAECCSGICDPTSGQCVCGAGMDVCQGACIPLAQYDSDLENCGGCRIRCKDKPPECHVTTCTGGACGILPDPALIGAPCGKAGGFCMADGSCACPPELPVACPKGCVDTATDVDNCGACGNKCKARGHASATCNGGVCEIACDAGYELCGDTCCAADRECCNGQCCTPNDCCGPEGCVKCRCRIGIDWYDPGVINPDHACQVCDPTRDPNGWSILDDGVYCGDDRACCNGDCCGPTECCDGIQCSELACPDQCSIQGQPYEDEQRNPANNCQYCDPDVDRFAWTLVGDNVACGGVAGRVCCNGECCSPTECCNPAGFCEECGSHCRIDGEDVDAGVDNPAVPCQVCDPDRSFTFWSTAPDDTECGVGRVCCDGACCPSGQCCNDGACGECFCEIGEDDEIRAGTVNPFNACEVCDPDRTQTDWTPRFPNSPCGLTDGRFCCDGDCCPQGTCCNAIGECEPCGCVILGNPVLENTVNPDNTCQVCNPGQDNRDWTTLGNGEACGGPDDDRVCCNGDCCPQGQCCINGACEPCGCAIGDDDDIAPGTINPDNPCQKCDPGRSRTSWSPVDEGTACGAEGDQVCCGGDCCPTGECCLLEACGECLCHIGDDNVAAGITHPTNPCLECDPDRDPFDWSPTLTDGACGPNGDQECCDGDCCDPGLCCTLGICGMCGCLIDDVEVAEFAVNEANECQWCDPVLDQFAWSPRSDEPCGANGDQVCCTGVCCEPGQRCGLDGQCEPIPCEIGGATVEAGTPNPGMPCQVCDPAQSVTDWSPAEPGTSCGDFGDQVCCEGACCPTGECCHSVDGVCGPEPCGCTIDGVAVAAGERNPDNSCEVCDPLRSETAWSSADHMKCGPDLNQVCCNGACCPDGDCCRPDFPGLACSIEWCGMVDPCDYEDPCGCTIDGVYYPHETINPANGCQVCDAYFSTTSWYSRGDFARCGPFGDQYCCNDTCCEVGACCNDDGVCEAGSPNCKGCVIGGRFYRHLTENPGNPCELCDADLSTTSWSIAPSNRTCGQMIGEDGTYWGNLTCCEGVCCEEWYTCCRADGTCGQEPCP